MIMYRLRPYQQEAANAGVRFMTSRTDWNGVIVLPTGSGKSLVIATIAAALNAPVLVFQPSKEILEQNYAKYTGYGFSAGIFSASFGKRQIRRVTFATIGSVRRFKEYFSTFRYIIVDECHYVNPRKGMYLDFFASVDARILGLTATPYRLRSSLVRGVGYVSRLEFITRTSPRVFSGIIFSVQVAYLKSRGYLADISYFPRNVVDTRRLKLNSTGADFTEDSIRNLYREIRFNETLEDTVRRLLASGRKGVLVFTRFTDEARSLCRNFEGQCEYVTSETAPSDRERILSGFKDGRIKVVSNVGVLTTGFDYPELDTVVIARPTMSLALWYQMIGRAIRPYPGKVAWVVDLCGSFSRFGPVESLELRKDDDGRYAVWSGKRQLTDVPFQK